MKLFVRQLLVVLALALLGLAAQHAPAQSAAPGPATTADGSFPGQQPDILLHPPQRKPIPLPIKIAIVAGGLVIGAAALYFSMKAWRSSSLFDRQYRFPEIREVALRLGGTKSGGLNAVLQFESRAKPPGEL